MPTYTPLCTPGAHKPTHTHLHTHASAHMYRQTRARMYYGRLLTEKLLRGASWAPRTCQREPRCQWLLSSWPGSAKLLAGEVGTPTMPRQALWFWSFGCPKTFTEMMLPSSPFAVSEFSQKIFPAQRGLLSEQKLAHSTQYKTETIIANHKATTTIIHILFFH